MGRTNIGLWAKFEGWMVFTGHKEDADHPNQTEERILDSYGDPAWKYLKADGTYATGWFTVTGGPTDPGKETYYSDPQTGIMQRGWLKYQNHWYFLFLSENDETESGTHGHTIDWSPFRFRNTGDHHLGINGEMVTGWIEVDGYWYYCTTGADHAKWGANYPMGSMLASTYLDQNGKRYTFDASGHCQNP